MPEFDPDDDRSAPTLLGSAWVGAMVAARGVSLVLWPVALVASAIGLVPTWFAFGAGCGFSLHRFGVFPWTVFLVVMAAGMVVGVMVGLGRWLAWKRGVGSIWGRPISLVPRRFRRDRDRDRDVGRLPTGYVAPGPWGRRRRGWARWLGATALAVSALAFGAGLVAGPMVRGRLDRAIAEAERLDPRWRFEEILADRVPAELPEETSSSVVAEVYARLPEGWLRDKPVPPPRDGTAGPPDSPLRLASDRVIGLDPTEPIDPLDLATIFGPLSEHHNLVDRALALADLGEGYHELVPTPNPHDMLLAETQHSRAVAHLLLLQVAVDLAEERADDAIDDARAILGVARSIGDEPALISGLVRAVANLTAINAAERALAEGEPSAEALGRLQSDLIAARGVDWLGRGLRGERAMLDELIRRIRDGELSLDQIHTSHDRPAGVDRGVAPWGRLSLDNQRAVALEWGNRLVALGSAPFEVQSKLIAELDADIVAEAARPFSNYTSTFPVRMFPAYHLPLESQNRGNARLGALAVLVAADRHRLAHGDWPASATAIDPAILPHPPLDPFTARPFVMERSGGRFRVHSVGPNLVDEHGEVDYKQAALKKADDFGVSMPEVPPGSSPAGPGR